MKKWFKKTVAVVLTAAMAMSVGTPVFATEDKNVVSIEEYEQAVQAEAVKYGIEYEVLNYDPDKVLTKDTIEKGVNDVRIYAESFQVMQKDTEATSAKAMRVMPLDKDVSKRFLIASAFGTAEMMLDANVTVDAQNAYVMRVNSVEAYQSGLFSGFKSWTTTSISSRLNSPSQGWVSFTVNGRATFSYADPITGIENGYTSNISEPVEIKCG